MTFPDEQIRLAEISRLSRELEAVTEFSVDAFSPGLGGCLALEGAVAPFRVSQVDEGGGLTLRLRAEPGLDLRVVEQEGRITLQGRRRPEFHLYEYLSSELGPALEENSRLESMERVLLRSRSADGALMGLAE